MRVCTPRTKHSADVHLVDAVVSDALHPTVWVTGTDCTERSARHVDCCLRGILPSSQQHWNQRSRSRQVVKQFVRIFAEAFLALQGCTDGLTVADASQQASRIMLTRLRQPSRADDLTKSQELGNATSLCTHSHVDRMWSDPLVPLVEKKQMITPSFHSIHTFKFS